MILLSSIGDSKALSESDRVGWDGNSANNMQMWHMRGSGRMVSRQWCSTRIWHAVCVQRASCLEQSGVLLMSNMGVRWRFWKSNEIDDQSASNDTLCTYVTSAGWWSVRWWSHIALGKVIPLWLWPRAYISVIVCLCARMRLHYIFGPISDFHAQTARPASFSGNLQSALELCSILIRKLPQQRSYQSY